MSKATSVSGRQDYLKGLPKGALGEREFSLYHSRTLLIAMS